ncbi:uncharacterized protein LOC106163407 [Lingula anatina]|uniref:Uncharacterized protein LOC106163407 n=1 Tax=Lingula anatina TaxID=7574 RepID=A0A1S3IDV2_LINAN|nr:uncharacterized protein LOC106163407 [Lingula anatina]XP_023931703.1 uncharacterized protein LOC106163407 [Lingula anatina]|eukprot:XP_013396435.2 uncharacterized protein LOC106163407 [Lingula anatina]
MDLEKADPALMKTEEEEEKEEIGDHSQPTSLLQVAPPHDDKEKDESQPTSAVTCNPANSIETKSTEASPEVISTDSTTSPEVTSCNDVVTDPHVTSTAAGTSHDEAKTAPEMAPNLNNENSQKSPSSSPTFQEILDQNRDRCLLEMQPDSVLEELFQKGDITAEEYEEICRVPMRADRSAKLIGFLKESTVDTFHSFCTSLRNTDQLILAQALGAIGPIRVKIKLTSSVKQEGLKLIALGLLNDKARNTNVLRSGTSEARCTHVQTIDLGTVILTCQCHDMKALEELKLIYEDGSLTHMFESWAGLDEAGDDQRRYAVGVKVDVQIDPKEFHDVAEELKILEEAEIYREQQKAFILRQREKKAEEKAELNQRAYADVIIQMETTDLSEEALREMFAQAGPFIESDNESIDGVLVLPENIFVNSESLLHLAEIELTVLGLRWSSVTPLEIKSQLQRLIATKVLHKEPSDTELEIVTLNVKTCWGSEEASILKDTADHNSEDAENVRIKLLRIFLPTLTAFLPLEEFVYKIRVLTSADKEHVLFQQRRSGRSHAVTALMETLILRPCWYKEFLHTLEHMDTDDGKFILSVLAGCQNIPTQSMVKFLQKSDELLEVMRMAMTMGDENIL